MDIFAERCPWYVAGPLIGLLVTGFFAVANRPLGASGGFIDLVALARDRAAGVRWTVFFLAGIVAGGLLSAVVAGGWRPTWEYGSFDQRFGTGLVARLSLLALAGAVMGYGIRTAGGCTSGHGICGTAVGSRASWTATGAFMLVAVLAANAIGAVVGGAR